MATFFCDDAIVEDITAFIDCIKDRLNKQNSER